MDLENLGDLMGLVEQKALVARKDLEDLVAQGDH